MPNFKFALRTLFKTPFVTLVAIISLALGIGANAAIFSIFNRLLLAPLPVAESGRLVNLSAPAPKASSGHADIRCASLSFVNLSARRRSLSAIR